MKPILWTAGIGSSGRVGGAKKHEIYTAIFFTTYLYRAWGGAMAPSVPTPPDPLLTAYIMMQICFPESILLSKLHFRTQF